MNSQQTLPILKDLQSFGGGAHRTGSHFYKKERKRFVIRHTQLINTFSFTHDCLAFTASAAISANI